MLTCALNRHVATIARRLTAQGVTPSVQNVVPILTRLITAKQLQTISAYPATSCRYFSATSNILAPKTATTASKAGRPKGSKTDPAKKKKPAAAKKQKTKAKAKPKPKAKPKRKPAAKKKPKAKPKTKTVLPYAKLRADVKQLIPLALLDTPKRLPETSFALLLTQNAQKGTNNVGQVAKSASTAYRQMSTSERQHLHDQAGENRVKNNRAIASFIASHTPDEIRAANVARRRINLLAKKSKTLSRNAVHKHVATLKDTRIPKQPDTPYVEFTRERWASGDYNGVPIPEAGKAIATEWKALGAQEKQQRQAEYKPMRDGYRKEKDALFPGMVKARLTQKAKA